MELDCGAVVQEFETTSSQSASTVQTFQVDALAIGLCTLQASNLDYDSNIIQLTFNQQLFIASSLIGWTGGQTVQVNVTSRNLLSDPIPFLITCPTQSVSYTLQGSTLTPVTLPASLNGIGCLLSKQFYKPNYLNLPLTSLNIALSQVTTQSVVKSLNSAIFIRSITDSVPAAAVANNAANQPPAQKRFKKRQSKLTAINKRKLLQMK